MDYPATTLAGSAQPSDAARSGSDEDLAVRAQTDAHAFAELYRRHVDPVYRYLLVRTGSRTDAEDLTEETFLAALESITSYRGQGPFAAWLFGVARYKLSRHYRRARRTEALDVADDLPHPGPAPDASAEQMLALEAIARALRTISPERGEALALRIFGGLSTAQVSQVMGKSEAAVKMLIHRAVRDLRARLGPGQEVESSTTSR